MSNEEKKMETAAQFVQREGIGLKKLLPQRDREVLQRSFLHSIIILMFMKIFLQNFAENYVQ